MMSHMRRARKNPLANTMALKTVGVFKGSFGADSLLEDVVKAEEARAIARLHAKPELLFEECSAPNYYGEYIESSPYKAALGADDYDLLEDMKPFIEKNPQVAIQQFCELFPESRHEFNAEHKHDTEEPQEETENNFGKLMDLVNAISADNFEVACSVLSMPTPPAEGEILPFALQAAFIRCDKKIFYINQETKEYEEKELTAAELDAFDREIQPSKNPKTLSRSQLNWIAYKVEISHEAINAKTAGVLQEFLATLSAQDTVRPGKKCNAVAQMLKDAFKIGDSVLNNWVGKRFEFFSRRVMGFIERYLPANYAQAFCMGLIKAIKAKLLRSLKLGDNDSFFSPSLGFASLVYSHVNGMRMAGLQAVGAASGAHFIKLCDKKTDARSQFKDWLKSLLVQDLKKESTIDCSR